MIVWPQNCLSPQPAAAVRQKKWVVVFSLSPLALVALSAHNNYIVRRAGPLAPFPFQCVLLWIWLSRVVLDKPLCLNGKLFARI